MTDSRPLCLEDGHNQPSTVRSWPPPAGRSEALGEHGQPGAEVPAAAAAAVTSSPEAITWDPAEQEPEQGAAGG